ncbi:hypothetical protein [Streptomyces sp. NPDC051219]
MVAAELALDAAAVEADVVGEAAAAVKTLVISGRRPVKVCAWRTCASVMP